MRFASVFTSLLLVPLALATPIQPRAQDDAAVVTADVADITASLAKLSERVAAFNGDLLQSLGVIAAQTELDINTIKTTKALQNAEPFNATASMKLTLALAGTLGPIQSGLQTIQDKYPVFRKVLQAPIVLLSLVTLKSHTDNLIDAAIEKIQNPALLQAGKTLIDEAFDKAIDTYKAL